MSNTTPDVSENNAVTAQETAPAEKKKLTFKQKILRAIAKKMRKMMDIPEGEAKAPAKPKENKNKPKNAKKTFKRLFGYVMKSKALFALVLLLVIGAALFSVASTAINEPIVNLCQKVLDVNN